METDQGATVASLLRRAKTSLHLIDSAHLDSELLLAHVLGVDRSWLFAHSSSGCTTDQKETYFGLIDRRARGEPFAYLINQQSFWEDEFFVSEGALIPRPDTERVIEIVLATVGSEPKTVLDLGTGSGCIAVSLAKARPSWSVYASDIESDALAVAKKNIKAAPNCLLIQADWLKAIRPSSVDVIVSNPPYIAPGDPHLADLSFEPERALVAEQNGYAAYAAILREAPSVLRPSGTLVFEHGYEQQAKLSAMARAAGFSAVGYNDLSGLPRVLVGTRS